MSNTAKTWNAKDGTDPYGKPAPKGNAHEAWRLLNVTPCPKCGGHQKRMTVVDGKATIICTSVVP